MPLTFSDFIKKSFGSKDNLYSQVEKLTGKMSDSDKDHLLQAGLAPQYKRYKQEQEAIRQFNMMMGIQQQSLNLEKERVAMQKRLEEEQRQIAEEQKRAEMEREKAEEEALRSKSRRKLALIKTSQTGVKQLSNSNSSRRVLGN